MRMLLAVAAMAAALGMNDTVLAEGSVEAGQQKAAVCLACHGPEGNSMNPEWPSLAGQHAEFIVAQLEAFQSGERQNPLMSPMAIGLTEQDMLDLGAYYEAQQPAALEADPGLVDAGRQLYLGGDQERGITACTACHGPTGQGNPLAGYPMIAGQHAAYSALALRAYASGERANAMMQDIASRMSEEDIEAVTSYIQGLR
ncbi:c-type cytochrome [Thioalkalivibrio sp. XN8]|uniref:c-type cytochrome n=1 Tax=Thioalkalivibrio sp. XN8 TaxID=2712863 RepID=UPI0013EAB652|nr:c-type cytochrome [Thioalkalivibrio sp. XN8]NGP52539.1 cytochrome c4 [Thioalkalivibrio sp. XN8]